MAKILFDPNTGARLSAGQSVVSKETGQTLTQGQEFVPYTPPTPPADTTSDIPTGGTEFGASGKGEWTGMPEDALQQAEKAGVPMAGLGEFLSKGGGYTPQPGYGWDEKGALVPMNPPEGYTRNASGALVPTINRSIRSGQGTDQNLVTPGASSGSRSTAGMSQEEIDAQEYLDTSFEKPKTRDEIIAERTAQSKERIASLNDYYASQRANLAPLTEMRSREANAQAVLRGLSGSSEAGTIAEGATKKNINDQNAIAAEQNMKLMEIYSGIQDFADKESIRQKEVATGTAKDILSRGATARKEALTHLETIAKNPAFDIEKIKVDDPATYNALAQSVGGEDLLKGIVFASRPKATIVGTPQRIGDYMQQNIKQADGSVKSEYIKLPADVLATDSGKFKSINTDNGTFVSKDGGENWTQLANSMKPGAGGGISLATATKGLEYGTQEYTIASIKNSSQYGDKRLLADERKNITASKRALGSLELYNQAIKGTLDKTVAKETFGEETGVIKGRIRTLAGVWGADPSAAAVNAVIQGIIPTVARGIFQEVGVLTDQDIANYKKVVPDINKPENANKLIELVLLKTLERSYADTLLTASQNQTNVSNFAAEYQNVLDRTNKLLGTPTGGKALSQDVVSKIMADTGMSAEEVQADYNAQYGSK